MWVTTENLRSMMVNVPAEQAEKLVPGCETWAVEPVPGVVGQITVWPESREAAVTWGGGSFWGVWHEKDELVELNEPVQGFTLVVSRDGTLWVVLSLEMFRAWWLEKFFADIDSLDLTPGLEGQTLELFKIKVGCSILPIYKGAELARTLLDRASEEEDSGRGRLPLQ